MLLATHCRRSYRKNEVIEENKALLKEKYGAAKALGKQVCTSCTCCRPACACVRVCACVHVCACVRVCLCVSFASELDAIAVLHGVVPTL